MILLRLPRPPILALPSSSHDSPTPHRLRLNPVSSASFSPLFSSSGSAAQRPAPASSRIIPPRDRVIDFGKHRGRMLGTLPSSYLTWVSKNLRARDYEEWARLADEVLQDPVYRDRLEWEAAERVLTGVGSLRSSSTYSPSVSAAAELLDISERFGWDNDDKDGWSRVDFHLLGTSKGGRIPRLQSAVGSGGGGRGNVGFLGTRKGMDSAGNAMRLGRKIELGNNPKNRSEPQSHGETKPSFAATGAKNSSSRIPDSSEKLGFTDKNCWVHDARRRSGTSRRSEIGYLSEGFRFTVGEEEEERSMEEVVKDKREGRRERQRVKREQQMWRLRREVGVDAGGGGRAVGRGRIVEEEDGGCSSNPFPGRGALLDKIEEQEAL